MTFLHASSRTPAALVVAAFACALAPRTAHATSCGPVEVDFIVPSVAGYLDGAEDEAVAIARGPVPVDVRPRVALHADSCEGIDPAARLTILDAGGAEVAGEAVKIHAAGGPVLELVLAAPLEPDVEHQLCVHTYGCMSFRTAEAIADPPPTPTLSLAEPSFTDDGDWVATDVVGTVTWEPFVGAVWLEARDDRPILGSAVVERDAQSRGEGSAALSRNFRVGDEACVVAVARAANGATAESAPSCFTVQEPEGGCSIGAVPRRGPGAGLALGVAALGAAVLRRRRRR